MTDYALTRAAQVDLEDIARSTAIRWGLPQAEAYLGALEEAFGMLATLPELARPFAEREGYFRYESGSHVIFFRKRPDLANTVLIVRVLHRRMEPDRHLPTP